MAVERFALAAEVSALVKLVGLAAASSAAEVMAEPLVLLAVALQARLDSARLAKRAARLVPGWCFDFVFPSVLIFIITF